MGHCKFNPEKFLDKKELSALQSATIIGGREGDNEIVKCKCKCKCSGGNDPQ